MPFPELSPEEVVQQQRKREFDGPEILLSPVVQTLSSPASSDPTAGEERL